MSLLYLMQKKSSPVNTAVKMYKVTRKWNENMGAKGCEKGNREQSDVKDLENL